MKLKSLSPQNLVFKLENIIESRILLYVGLLFFLGFSTPQFAMFISNISRLEGFSELEKFNHGLSYAIGIEVAVFILATLGKTAVSKRFAIVSGVFQLLALHRWEELYNYNDFESFREFSGSLILAVMSPGAIWYFSELIAEKRREGKIIIELEEQEQKLTALKQDITEAYKKLALVQNEERDSSRRVTDLNKRSDKLEDETTALELMRTALQQELTSLKKAKGGAASTRSKDKQEVTA